MDGERNNVGNDEAGALSRSEEGLNRRTLLGAAASGFALAASGLVLPEWPVEEAEAADNHPVRRIQERKEQKRAKRGHDRHHQRRRRPSKHHKRGDIVPTHPAIEVGNLRTAPVQTRGLQRDSPYHPWHVPNGWDWDTIPPKIADDNYTIKQFLGDGSWVVVQTGTDRVVRFYFEWPFSPYVEILSGGWEWDGWNPVGQTLVAPTHLAINDSVSAPGITATRIDDTNRHVWLKVKLT